MHERRTCTRHVTQRKPAPGLPGRAMDKPAGPASSPVRGQRRHGGDGGGCGHGSDSCIHVSVASRVTQVKTVKVMMQQLAPDTCPLEDRAGQGPGCRGSWSLYGTNRVGINWPGMMTLLRDALRAECNKVDAKKATPTR